MNRQQPGLGIVLAKNIDAMPSSFASAFQTILELARHSKSPLTPGPAPRKDCRPECGCKDIVMIGMSKEFVYPAVATAIALAGAATDIKSRKIPNLLTGPAILFGLVLHASLDGWRGLLTSLAAGLICGFIFLLFYLAGGMGAGDVKLIAAVGCLAGLSNIAYLLILTSIAGGVMGVVFALMRGRLKETLLNVGTIATHHKEEGLTPHPDLNVMNVGTLRLPYGVAIAAGSTITFYLLGLSR